MENIRIVMVATSHPGNIGAAARAMKTMGLDRLCLVAPERFPHRDANAMAAGADDVLETAQVVDSLEVAVADCRTVLGCTARVRGVALPELGPAQAARRLLQASADAPVALLFGRERTGLTNEELQRCHAAVHIPTAPDYGSLNVAAAVQVMSYELRQAWLAERGDSAGSVTASGIAAADVGELLPAEPPASQAQLDRFFGHLDQTLLDIDFHKGRSPVTVMQRLRRLFLRANPSERELRILRGIFADAQRMARLAGDRDDPGPAPVPEPDR